ncbi:MAG TPA: YhjD/YihY/BrkB family envelope integrity protein [Gaiellaceae bacterium]|nr:YhjD/YihY/BrkB family envelope integrity protein [Gaiellaceae bacterium]
MTSTRPPEAPSERPPRGRASSVRARGEELYLEIERRRPEHVSIEVAFRWFTRDKEIAGGVLGGGMAYRFFFWIMALAVLAAGGLGFASSSGADVTAEAQNAGLADALASTVATAASQSESGRWWLLLSGAFLVLWFSYGLLRALRLVHAAAWRVAAPPVRRVVRALAAVVAAPVAILAVTGAAAWVRLNASRPVGFLVTLSLCLLFALAWLWISTKLPAALDVDWTAFLPGAALFAVGLEALHLFTVYYLQTKLANASELYGVLGLATTALFYFFLIGRGVVWAAEVNAVVWEVRSERREAASTPARS